MTIKKLIIDNEIMKGFSLVTLLLATILVVAATTGGFFVGRNTAITSKVKKTNSNEQFPSFFTTKSGSFTGKITKLEPEKIFFTTIEGEKGMLVLASEYNLIVDPKNTIKSTSSADLNQVLNQEVKITALYLDGQYQVVAISVIK